MTPKEKLKAAIKEWFASGGGHTDEIQGIIIEAWKEWAKSQSSKGE